MHKNENLQICRICGLKQPDLPWGVDENTPTFDYCYCCGVEFGYQDSNIDAIRKYRTKWIREGAVWNEPEQRPSNWSLEEQLKDIPEKYL